MTYSSEGIPSHQPVGLVQPNKQDKPNNSLLPLADFSASCYVSGEKATRDTPRSSVPTPTSRETQA
jgi:hypothetical protein